MARGGTDESEYLTNTCPCQSYMMNDWGFVERWTAAQALPARLHGSVPVPGKTQVLEPFRGVWEGLDRYEDLEELERRIVADGLTHWVAFSGFCAEEMMVEGMKVLAAVTPHAAEKARELEVLASRLGAEPDPASVREDWETMEALWRRVLAKG
jgi:hypothetical protein